MVCLGDPFESQSLPPTQRDKREVIQDASTASLIKNHRAESELQRLTPGNYD